MQIVNTCRSSTVGSRPVTGRYRLKKAYQLGPHPLEKAHQLGLHTLVRDRSEILLQEPVGRSSGCYPGDYEQQESVGPSSGCYPGVSRAVLGMLSEVIMNT